MARSTTRASGAQPPPTEPSTAPASTRTSFRETSQSLRVWSMVGKSLTSSPGVALGTSNRLIPSSGCFVPAERATTTRTSARCASSTKSFVPLRTQPPGAGLAVVVTPAASHRPLGSVQASAVLARPAAILGSHASFWAEEPASRMVRPPRRTVDTNGPGITARPISSIKTVRSTKPRPAAPVRLGKHEAEPALLGHLGPELIGDTGRLRHPLAHKLRRALVLEKLARGGTKKLLLVVEAEIHGEVPPV